MSYECTTYKTWWVVIPDGLGITKRLQNRIGLDDLVFKIATGLWGCGGREGKEGGSWGLFVERKYAHSTCVVCKYVTTLVSTLVFSHKPPHSITITTTHATMHTYAHTPGHQMELIVQGLQTQSYIDIRFFPF